MGGRSRMPGGPSASCGPRPPRQPRPWRAAREALQRRWPARGRPARGDPHGGAGRGAPARRCCASSVRRSAAGHPPGRGPGRGAAGGPGRGAGHGQGRGGQRRRTAGPGPAAPGRRPGACGRPSSRCCGWRPRPNSCGAAAEDDAQTADEHAADARHRRRRPGRGLARLGRDPQTARAARRDRLGGSSAARAADPGRRSAGRRRRGRLWTAWTRWPTWRPVRPGQAVGGTRPGEPGPGSS